MEYNPGVSGLKNIRGPRGSGIPGVESLIKAKDKAIDININEAFNAQVK
jgi:hypothetical protein